ncbi:MAG: hypothetical protein QOG34_2538 [Frankiaceae bacterium]|jgi:hypothetical protein|nr:hypothetical protein [Frankiaceae bacterium]
MTQALAAPEQTGPTGRAARIAAIYAFAHWLIEHPDVPAPTRVTATWWTHVAEEVDEPTRIAGLTAVAEQLGERVIGEPTKVMLFAHRIAGEQEHGIDIEYQGAITTDAYERQRAAGRF